MNVSSDTYARSTAMLAVLLIASFLIMAVLSRKVGRQKDTIHQLNLVIERQERTINHALECHPVLIKARVSQ